MGLILNKVKDDWTSEQVKTQAKGYLKSESLEKTIFKTQIKYMDRFGSSSVNRKPIVFIENHGIGRQNFMELAKEFLKRAK
jgi:cellulose biosynthesis protein BcsQ